nr:hypothetical protein [Citrobacter freundii]
MTSREKFEAWAKDNGMSLVYGDCDYVYSPTVWAWKAWQAAETSMAVQLANAESKCRELAAELSAVDKIHNEAVFITDDHYEQCPPEVQKMIRSLAVLQIPAYNDFLAEARAQGVEMFADDLLCPDLDSTIREFADQLRKGAAL